VHCAQCAALSFDGEARLFESLNIYIYSPQRQNSKKKDGQKKYNVQLQSNVSGNSFILRLLVEVALYIHFR